MRIAWLSDIHLDFYEDDEVQRIAKQINEGQFEYVWISGDISRFLQLDKHLKILTKECDTTTFMYVLGNHDYYQCDSVAEAREYIDYVAKITNSVYLQTALPYEIYDNQFIIGVDSWADGRNGAFKFGGPIMNDSYLIKDLNVKFKKGIRPMSKEMARLADVDNKYLEAKLFDICSRKTTKKVTILTHVPPFEEVARYNGLPTCLSYLPYFSCQCTGKTIRKYAKKYNKIQFEVLCGHTHDEFEALLEPNLKVKVAGSEYGEFKIQEIIEL